MSSTKIRRRTALASGAAALLASPAVLAQAFPSKPVTLVIPFPAGGPSDVFGRLLARGMSERLGQPVVVDSKSGAGGVIGIDFVAKAAPDGHVIGLTSPSAVVLNPQLMAKMPYDAQKDLAPLTLVTRVQEVLGVHPDAGIGSIRDLIAKARANPGKLTYGSAGTGGITHLAGELLAREAGINIVHVPYRGAAPATVDLLGGRVDFAILDITVLLSHFRSGKIKPVMITSASRAALLPDVPNAVESGLAAVNSDNWYGLVTAAGVPEAARARLTAAAVETLKTKEIVEAYAAQGGVVDPGTPEAFGALIAAERTKWGAIIRAANIKLDQ